jgi:type IV pilus assembly protein PilP
MSVRSYALILTCVLSAQNLACDDETPTASGPKPTEPKAKKSRKDKAPEVAVEKATAPRFELPIDFNDSARTRDPFLSYAREFAEEAKKRVRSQREVVLDQYALDELKLAGLVTGIRPARAMLIDPTKKGHVVHEGQFVGRSEVVQGGASGADYEINWRIDRIRDTDIVLVREDPANPDVPSATRVILLRPDDVVAAAM